MMKIERWKENSKLENYRNKQLISFKLHIAQIAG